MANKLLATIDIGSISCIMLIAAFEPAPTAPAPAENSENPDATPAAETRKILVPKLQKVKICNRASAIKLHS